MQCKLRAVKLCLLMIYKVKCTKEGIEIVFGIVISHTQKMWHAEVFIACTQSFFSSIFMIM